MDTDFAMLDQAVLASMHKLNRIFDGDNMIVALQIRVIHHCGQRR